VAAHYQHLTLIAARRAAAKARGKRNKKDGKDSKDGQVRAQSDIIALNSVRQPVHHRVSCSSGIVCSWVSVTIAARLLGSECRHLKF